MLYPQYMIDAKDTALLHVGALIHPDYKSERVFGYAHRKTWTDWIARLKKLYPEHEFPGQLLLVSMLVECVRLT